jgi:hypothetical protein
MNNNCTLSDCQQPCREEYTSCSCNVLMHAACDEARYIRNTCICTNCHEINYRHLNKLLTNLAVIGNSIATEVHYSYYFLASIDMHKSLLNRRDDIINLVQIICEQIESSDSRLTRELTCIHHHVCINLNKNKNKTCSTTECQITQADNQIIIYKRTKSSYMCMRITEKLFSEARFPTTKIDPILVNQ